LPFSLFLAHRYLKPKRTFLSIITFIAVLGVMLKKERGRISNI